MDEKKVDIWEFQQAVAYMDTDPIKARDLFKKYIEAHPQDYIAYTYYSSTFVIAREFDKAKEILDHVEELVREDEVFNEFKSRRDFFNKMSTFVRVKILAYTEEYETLDRNHDIYLKKLNDILISEVEFITRLKTGQLKDAKREEMGGYVFKQLFEYKEEDFKQHIKSHLYQYNEGGVYESEERSIFAPDFPLDKILEEIKKYIPSDKALCFGFTQNTYVFKYDCCGKQEHKITDYFEVVTIHGTNNILSMYPTSRGMKLPCTDLNYIQESNISKKKGMSQIDKFNRRYKR